MSPSVIALIAANLVPLVGALFFGWGVFEVFAVYWSENVVIGVFMILRLALSPALSMPAAIGMSAFFTAHYGLFCFVHSVFVVVLVGNGTELQDFTGAPLLLLATAAGAGGLGLIALTASHGVSFFVNYLRRERGQGLPNLFAPYRRVVAMHVVLLAGGFLMFLTGRGPVMLALLIAAKVVADIKAHRAEHRPREPGGDRTDDPSDYIALE